ncbi:MAG: HEAT repeat domain-containing protein [Planctomycetota bacterium]|jgi:HEAT repeat protein
MSDEINALREKVKQDPFDGEAHLALAMRLKDSGLVIEAGKEYRLAWVFLPEDERPRSGLEEVIARSVHGTATRGLILDFLTESLETQAEYAKRAAEGFLLTSGKVSSLAVILKTDTELKNRVYAAKILGTFAQPELPAVEALISVLDTEDDDLYFEVVGALGNITSPASAKPLAASIAGASNERMCAALEALMKMGPFAREALNDIASAIIGKPLDIRIAAAKAIISLQDRRAIEFLSDMAKADEVEDRLAAATALAGADYPRSETLLMELIRDTDSSVREAAAFGLGMRKVDEGGKELFKLSRSQDPRDRAAVARAYGLYEDEEFVEPLFRLLNDPDRMVRYAAAEALAVYKNEVVTNRLWKVLESGTPRRQYGAVLALVCRRAPGARDGLIKLLKSPEAELRTAAAWGFGRTGRFRDIPVLQELLKDEDETVVEAARDAIARLSKPGEVHEGVATRRFLK